MKKIQIQYHQTSFGELIIGVLDDKLCLCDWRYRQMRNTVDTRIKNFFQAEFVEEKTTVFEVCKQELDEYFSAKRKEFSVPIIFAGTLFQQTVWEELMKIPYGKTESYLNLSLRLNNPKAIRAVAAANGANALAIIVPCHRIIGSNQELVGYAGGLGTKKKLLQLEGSYGKDDLLLF